MKGNQLSLRSKHHIISGVLIKTRTYK